MKHIKTIGEYLNEAVRVETNRYERSHGKKPRGYGRWAFYFDDRGGEPIFTPKTMNYSDAVKWAKEEAKKAGKEYIYVGESLNEARESNEPFTFSEKEVKDIADLVAKAIAKIDKVKTEVHDFVYDEGRGAGFDISMDGDESEGGSYTVRPNGDVVNDAIGNSFPNAVYAKIGDKNINQVIKNVKKFESFSIDEGIMSELSILAKEAKNVYEFIKTVFNNPEYKKFKDKKEVEDFLKTFYTDVIGESIDEAMVQVKGSEKPSGALVLAKVLTDALITDGYIKPTAREYKNIVAMMQQVIMNSTF